MWPRPHMAVGMLMARATGAAGIRIQIAGPPILRNDAALASFPFDAEQRKRSNHCLITTRYQWFAVTADLMPATQLRERVGPFAHLPQATTRPTWGADTRCRGAQAILRRLKPTARNDRLPHRTVKRNDAEATSFENSGRSAEAPCASHA